MQKRPYQLTHVVLVVGDLNLSGYFNLSSGITQPQVVVTTEDPDAEFSRFLLFPFLFFSACLLI